MINSEYDVDAVDIISRNDNAGEVNQLPDNVKRLYERWPSLAKEKPEKRARIADALRGEGWMKEEWPLTTADLQWLHTDPVSAKKDKRKNSSIEKG
jgi:hypothetical protein